MGESLSRLLRYAASPTTTTATSSGATATAAHNTRQLLLAPHQLRTLHVLRLLVVGYTLSSYLKARALSSGLDNDNTNNTTAANPAAAAAATRRPNTAAANAQRALHRLLPNANSIPFALDLAMMTEAAFLPSLLPAAVKRALQTYHFVMMYVGFRLAVASWLSDDDWLRLLSVTSLADWHPAVTLLLGLTAASAMDEVAYITTQLRLNTKAMLVARPLSLTYDGQTCCICQDTARTVGLVSFCRRSDSHASHWDCMTSWFESGAHLSNCCPVCRGPLRLQPLPLRDRLDVVFFSNQHWRILPNRLILLAGSVAAVGVVLLASVGLDTLQQQWRPKRAG